METLLATYIVAWAVVTGYVIRLAVANARLARRLERLEAQFDSPLSRDVPQSKVA